METTNRPSLKTELENRVLWYDGDSVMGHEAITELLNSGVTLPLGTCTDKMTPQIKQFNNFVAKEQKIRMKTECRSDFDFGWNIPAEYAELDVGQYVLGKLDELNLEPSLIGERSERVRYELSLFSHQNLDNFLRTLIFVVNTLLTHGVPWGVGRGSSVSSYVLYLIGVHDVDSVLYDLEITDFLRPVS